MLLKKILLVSLLSSGLYAQGSYGEDLVPCVGGGGLACTGNVIYVDAGSSVNGPGVSWDTAYLRLQAAIAAASDGDCIWVAGGTYYPDYGTVPNRAKSFTIDKSLHIYGGFVGNETCLADRGSLVTNLSGDIAGTPGVLSDDSYTIVELVGDFQLPGGEIEVLIDGFRIRNASNLSPTSTVGAGIDAREGVTLTLRNCTVRDTEGTDGAAIYFVQSDVDLIECRIKNNVSTGNGGAVSAASFEAGGFPGTLRAYNTVFRDNTATDDGGAIYFSAGSGPSKLQNCTLFGNSANRGGAAFLDVIPAHTIPGTEPTYVPATLSEAHFVNCTLTDNSVISNGPAIFADVDCGSVLYESAILGVRNSIVWDNSGPNTTPSCQVSNPNGEIHGDEYVTVLNSIVPTGSIFAFGSNVASDPLFTSATDFHLTSSSPAIDIGATAGILADVFDLDDDSNTSEYTPYDLDLRARVQGSEVDAGAYEY